MDERFAELEKKLQAQIASNGARIASQDTQIESLTSDKIKYQRKFTKISKELADLSKQYTATSKELTDVSKQHTATSQELADLSRQHTATSKELTDVSKQHTATSKQLAGVSNELSSIFKSTVLPLHKAVILKAVLKQVYSIDPSNMVLAYTI